MLWSRLLACCRLAFRWWLALISLASGWCGSSSSSSSKAESIVIVNTFFFPAAFFAVDVPARFGTGAAACAEALRLMFAIYDGDSTCLFRASVSCIGKRSLYQGFREDCEIIREETDLKDANANHERPLRRILDVRFPLLSISLCSVNLVPPNHPLDHAKQDPKVNI